MRILEFFDLNCRLTIIFKLSIVCLIVTISYCEVVAADSSRTKPFNNHVAGVILARCGSKGIKMKNLVRLGEESLLQRTLLTMQRSRRFSSIWVATECNSIAKEALLVGAQVFWRSAESATDEAPSIIAVREFLSKKTDVEIVGLFQCTSPFLSLPFIHSAFSLLSEGYDSVFSVNRLFKLRWNINPNGQATAANFDPTRRPRRQDWNGELVENGMFYFASRDLVSSGLLQGGRIGVVEVPTNCSMEIDTAADLDVARALVSRSRSESSRRC